MMRLATLNGAAVIADERKRTVQAAYDTGPRFGEWNERVEGDPWERFLDELAARLPDGGRVLDLGCGNGAKIARLAGSFDLVGVDFSGTTPTRSRQGARGDARRRRFQRAAHRRQHVRRGHRPLLDHARPPAGAPSAVRRIARWLKPGGLFPASLSHVGATTDGRVARG